MYVMVHLPLLFRTIRRVTSRPRLVGVNEYSIHLDQSENITPRLL